MNTISDQSISRIGKRAGVTSMTSNCKNIIRKEIDSKLAEIINISILVSSGKKTLTPIDLYEAIRINGSNITSIN